MKTLTILREILITISIITLGACAGTALQSDAGKVAAWNASPAGVATLSTVGAIAGTIEPEYAGVIGQAVNSLETGSLPSVLTAATAIAVQSGLSAKDAKVVSLASAVVSAAATAPNVNAGLAAAAVAINATAK